MATRGFAQRLVLAALLAAAASGFAFAAPAAPRVLALTGRASIPYKPDFVDLGFSVATRDPSYAEAQSRNLASVEAAMASLTSTFGIKREDITTLAYSLAERPIFEDGKRLGSEYLSETRMTVRVRALGSYRSIIVALLDAGVNGLDSISFGVEDYAPIREKAYVAAYADAERMAMALAAASHARLGAALVIREAGNEAPPVAFARAKLATAMEGSGEVISSGSLAFDTQLYVEFELLK